MAVQRRFDSVVSKRGESFTVGGAGRIGIFSVLSPERALTYLTQAEIDTAAKPLWVCMAPASDMTAVSDSVNWNGLTLSVLKAVEQRVGGVTVAKALILG